MNTDIRMHELHLATTMAERLEKAQQRQLLQRLSANRPGIVAHARVALGTRLIVTGEALRRHDGPVLGSSTTTAQSLGQ